MGGAFKVGEMVLVGGIPTKGRPGAELLGQTLVVASSTSSFVTTKDGSVWHTFANGGYNWSLPGQPPEVYQELLSIKHLAD